jgi:hypothetical protein
MNIIKYKTFLISLVTVSLLGTIGFISLLYYDYTHSCFYLSKYTNDDLKKMLDNKDNSIFTLTSNIGTCYYKQYLPFLIYALDSNFSIRTFGSKEQTIINEESNIALNHIYNKNYQFSPWYGLTQDQTKETINIWKNLYRTGQLN